MSNNISITLSRDQWQEMMMSLPTEWKRVLQSKIIKSEEKVLKKTRAKSKKGKKKWLDAEEFRKTLVAKQTEAEKIMKAKLKAANIKYDFQRIIYINDWKHVIVDFYLPETRTVLEIDGGYHKEYEQQIKDGLRTEELNRNKNIKVKRLSNQGAKEMSVEEISKFLEN